MSATCQPGAHVYTPLSDAWEPDLLTPCDCGHELWQDHLLAGMRAVVQAQTAPDSSSGAAPTSRATAPGPDPNTCDRCGGRMSTAIRSERTHFWRRTCTAPGCGYYTATLETPAEVRPPDRPPIASAVALPFGRFEQSRPVVAKQVRTAIIDARQRQAGERE